MGGEFTRLIHKAEQTAWQRSSKDRQTVYLAYFPTHKDSLVQSTQMSGLDSGSHYKCGTKIYTAETLELAGIQIPNVDKNNPSIFKLNKID